MAGTGRFMFGMYGSGAGRAAASRATGEGSPASPGDGSSPIATGHVPLRLAPEEYAQLVPLILEAETEGVVTRTFRRLDPEQHVAIIDAVLRELVEAGRPGATMRGIAERLGLSVASLYGYFPDREAMIEFAERAASRVIVFTAWDDWAPPSSLSLQEGLTHYLREDVDFSEQHWSMVALLAQAAYRGEAGATGSAVESIATGMRSHLFALLAEARDRGELRETLDAEATGAVVYALLTVLADARNYRHLNEYLQLVKDDGPSGDQIAAAALDMIVHGICRNG